MASLNNKRKYELLSPAGSFAALRAAVENGADAVYLGAQNFSARQGAVNFSDEELEKAVIYCHERGVLVYLAVNTLFYEKEFENLGRLIELACRIGIDAIIVQDLGMARFIRRTAPTMPLHASTQTTVHSVYGVLALAKAGFRRVVLARELTFDEIAFICKNVEMELEVFVHGALCISYSGRCLMSSMIGGRSGNRGNCAQPCRLPYKTPGGQGFYLSPRDLSLVEDIEALRAAGVRSLKIEGRMKSPEYVAVVTDVYRRAIDEGQVTKGDIKRLGEIFCRGDGFTRAYFGSELGRPMMNINQSNDNISASAPKKLIREAAESFSKSRKKLKIDIEFIYTKGTGPALIFKEGGQEVQVTGSKSDTPPLLAERIREQITKLGSTPFIAGEVFVKVSCPIKISELNRMRREAAAALSEKLVRQAVKPFVKEIKTWAEGDIRQREFDFSAHVQNMTQARAAVSVGIKRIYMPVDLCRNISEITILAQVFAVLPAIIKPGERDDALLDLNRALENGVSGFFCDSLDAITVASKLKVPIIGGMGLNITNSLSLEFYRDLGLESATVSSELSTIRARTLSKKGIMLLEGVVYGRLPLMLTENCITKISGGKCSCKSELTDRTGAVFPVLKHQKSCRSVIYNSRPLYMGDKLQEVSGFLSWGQMYFTVESFEECVEIIRKYREGEACDGEFTRGYW